MKNKVEDWLERLARSRHEKTLLFGASFAETVIVPIPIELILVPYMAIHRARMFWLATIVLAGCLAGALFGYLLGYLFFETAGRWAIETFGWQAGYAEFLELFQNHGFWAIIAVGIIPIPFQIGMLTAGAAGYPLPLFLLAAFIARGVRYYGLALVVYLVGEHVIDAWRHNRRALLVGCGVAAGLLLAGYYGYKLWW
jgi:membrane protein YqaA with SNARE-associated domain